MLRPSSRRHPVSRRFLSQTPLDVKLTQAARNAVGTCLGVRADERCTLIVERSMVTLSATFEHALRELGCALTIFRLDAEACADPKVVDEVLTRLRASDASLLISTPEGIPASLRRRVCAETRTRRHAHMPGLTTSMMYQSMRADYREVQRLGERLIGELARGGTLRVRTPRGTDLSVEIEPRFRWHNEGGILRAPGWMNLPAGEVITTPGSVDGVLVPDGGAYDEEAEAFPSSLRMTMRFERGALVDLDGPTEDTTRLLAILDGAKNGRRVGQVAFGTNLGVLAQVGELLQDLKLPGFHLSFGHSAPELTGAEWESPIECPVLIRKPDVDFGDLPILRGGKYVDRLREPQL